MVQKAYKAGECSHNTTVIKGIIDSNFSPNVELFDLQGGGALDPFNNVSLKSDQTLGFTTTDIASFLDLCGIGGLAISGSALFKQYYRLLADGGTVTGGSTDVLLTVNKGLLSFGSISCQQFGYASLIANVTPTFDGTNAPIVVTATGTTPTQTRQTEVFTVGTLSANGTAVPIVSMNLDLGLRIEKIGSDGHPYNTECFIVSRNPKVSFGIHNLSNLIAAGISPMIGKVSGGNVIFYLRKMLLGGGSVPNATEEHIKFTSSGGTFTVEPVSAGQNALANFNLVYTPVWDVSNAIFVIDTTAAIT